MREMDRRGHLTREMFRYMGYGGNTPDPEVAAEAELCLTRLLEETEPKTVWRRFPLDLESGDIVRVEGMEIRSGALHRNLKDCKEVILMAATLGMAPDRMAARAQAAGKMSRAVMLQAAAAALIEEVCDELNEQLRLEAAGEGKTLRPRFSPGYGDFRTLRPRFSPGYGDFRLEHQAELFRILEVQKRIGVTLTEHLLMMPSKSVTAVIGISDTAPDTQCGEKEAVPAAGCGACDRTDCSFRRNAPEEACERSHA